MKSEVVPVKNVMRLAAAGEALIKRAPGMPGIGLVHGETGYGKTTAMDWYANKVNAVYVRARATWTPKSMLGAIAKELRLPPKGSCDDTMEAIIERLCFARRPVFVDEADYIVDSKKMTESLRDLHDNALVPVILIGMGQIEEKLAARKQFTGRVMQNVQFHPLDIADTRKVADSLCEVGIRDDLLAQIHSDANGACRNIVVSLAEAERIGKARGLRDVGVADLGRRGKLFTGEAPKPSGNVVAMQGAQ